MVGPDFDEENEGEVKEVASTMPVTSASTPLCPTTQRSSSHRSTPEVQEQWNPIKGGLIVENNVSSKRANTDEDDCDLFAKILAKKLRKLPEHERLLLMYEIDGMFINRLCGNNSSPIPVSSYSHVATVDDLNGPSLPQIPRSDSSNS